MNSFSKLWDLRTRHKKSDVRDELYKKVNAISTAGNVIPIAALLMDPVRYGCSATCRAALALTLCRNHCNYTVRA